MISVIIPTMWKPPHLSIMLPMLDRNSLIGEIILIDNDTTQTNHKLLEKISKLRYFSFAEGNIYVNPAWNCGATVSKYEKLFFLNDDCLVNLISLQKIYDMIVPENGILGFSENSYCNFEHDCFNLLCSAGYGSNLIIKEINPGEFKKMSGMPHFYYGSAMFMHKKNYHFIPENLKVHFGDLIIYLENLRNGLFNFMIYNGLVVSKPSYTVSTLTNDLVKKDNQLIKKIMVDYGLENVKYKVKSNY
jgi:hypothetical protein